MSRAASVSTVAIFLGSAVTASAQGWEVSILTGWTAPTFEEEFVFSPDIDLPDIPGGSIRQDGEFALKAKGSFAFGGSVSYFFNEHVAIEVASIPSTSISTLSGRASRRMWISCPGFR